MIWIGNQTACFASTPLEPFEYALAQGFNAFEWFPDKKPGAGWDENDLDQSTRQRLRDEAVSRGIRFSVHARWQTNLLAPDSYPLILKDLELAHDLGAALLNVHLFHEQGLEVFVETILPLMRRTVEAGMQLSIENTPDHSPELFNDLFARLRALAPHATSHVGMCLDLGHANLCAATRNDYLGFYDRLDQRVPIIHLHLHENWGDADSHLPLFTGPAARNDAGIRGLISRLERRNFSGSIILEQWPHPASLLNNARDKLLSLWNSSGDGTTPKNNTVSALPEKHATPNAPAEDFVAELVSGNQRCRSWREKLDFVRDLLVRDNPPLTPDHLIDIAIYLRFLGTGEIACAEDGRHFRPAHHARIASQILERLANLTTSESVFIVRKIYPWLPSTSPAFQRAEPLTRIRDIAHRNDIEPDLKREIKTTLQNKLHRCAGPEDLVTSSALLERITAPGANCSPDFIEQFKIFHEELKEFFNARTLDEHLATLVLEVEAGQAELIELFRRQKTASNLAGQLAAFQTLTTLRRSLLKDFHDKPALKNQDLLLADIALEDFAFVLLSQIINALDNTKSEAAWESLMATLLLALENIALSEVDPPETQALQSELRAWGKISPSATHDDLLRLRATLLRSRRLAEDFGERTVALFSERAEKLGRALGVADHAIRVFSEAEIRAHIIFQVSKLSTSLLRRIRQRLGSQVWDVLVSGRAVGRAKMLESLDQLEPELKTPVIALLKNAAGDEEIPKNVVGIILTHELPHLSHLGVRARQEGVIFATCEEKTEFERLRKFEGQMLSFLALPDTVTWEPAAAPAQSASEPRRTSPQIPSVRLNPECPWLLLEHATSETGGGKATGARRLEELSHLNGAGFLTPPAIVVPFGVMEAQLEAAAVAGKYRELIERFGRSPAAEFATVSQQLWELVQKLKVPEIITSKVVQRFAHSRLIVRSSANCEDLEEFAGAGLYDSVMNVSPADVAAAVLTVWSSFWTRRAALSRQQAGIPHAQAHMAVLIQEMVVPDFSFVLHTVNPINQRVQELYAEIAVGLGDTLASATTRGSPYRMVCDKNSGETTVLAFANLSQASRPSPQGGLSRETVDYSRVELTRDETARKTLGRRLIQIGRFVETSQQKPQDIEGVVAGDKIYLVQARRQQGLASRKTA